jgi:Protein of unknown function (DUF3089)
VRLDAALGRVSALEQTLASTRADLARVEATAARLYRELRDEKNAHRVVMADRDDLAVANAWLPQLRATSGVSGIIHHDKSDPVVVMMSWSRRFALVLTTLVGVMALLLTSAGVAGADSNPANSPPAPPAPDYSQASNWLSLPASPKLPVDVFYLYPSTYRKSSPTAPVVGPIDDPGMIKGAAVAFVYQASAFEGTANIYAPYYQQADALSRSKMTQAQQVKVVGGIPTGDALSAFKYYIKHYNHGRPFFLAGHSFGSNVVANLLAGYMKANPKVYARMIAAYVIGYSITKDYLSTNKFLKFSKGPGDTGVIVSYNTEAPTIAGPNPVTLPGGVVINPITWTRAQDLATADQNLGSLLPNAAGNPTTVAHYADAQINLKRGVLICSACSTAKFAPGSALLPEGVFHSYDYLFYYYNLRQNIANRATLYLRAAHKNALGK